MKSLKGMLAAALACAVPFAVAPAAAQDFPSKPVKLVVGYSAGGPTDVLARLLAADLTEILGQSVIVENKPGAAGRIGTEYVAQSAPDGYTLTVSTLAHNVNPLLFPKSVKYHPLKDFSPVVLTSLLPMVAVTAYESPANSLEDIVKRARANPGAVTYGSSGNGGSAHLAAALLETLSETKMNHVPFKGNGPALIEVMAGRVDFMFYPMVGIKQHIEQKKIKPLAVTTAARHPDYPDTPTTAEQGLKGFEEYTQGIGVLAPAGTPADVVAKLNKALNESLKRPATAEKLRQLGAIVVGGAPEDFRNWLAKDAERWDRVIRAANVKVE
ncbi:tripartite tricarboxylate transporter substrate binding protein [Burkholderiaceae bacterium FT117]|uniref:Bug family tripartite tricarboxylate transporter substrate binding protein n=1 Tax=Zeimonas sediminis TaxID=2944268 RepID=UPI00234320E2|nr:tripartite tricarboxylate transporter substrate binding protein [Zeimonas sediminis]MCM5571363.1 tripartite tricarboxylate transporter substrate binding protein [Zeimonas sediminis]